MPILLPNTTAQVRTAQYSQRSSRAAAGLRLLELWHLTSLDAPTVALAWASGFAWAAGTHLPRLAAAVIVLGVWTVYVGDRLLDARSALRRHSEHRLRERHYFHWRHRRVLMPLAGVAGAVVAILVLACVPVVARERDTVLAAASLAYFARVHRSQLSAGRGRRLFMPPVVTKELLVGLLFAVGCALPALGAVWTAPGPMRWELMGCVAFFAALAWLNCHAIERWESDAELRNELRVARFALGLSLAGLGAAVLLCSANLRLAMLLLAGALSALLIALLDRTRAGIAPVTLRATADLVLLLPALLVAFTRMVR